MKGASYVIETYFGLRRSQVSQALLEQRQSLPLAVLSSRIVQCNTCHEAGKRRWILLRDFSRCIERTSFLTSLQSFSHECDTEAFIARLSLVCGPEVSKSLIFILK